jgi:hypothetical protein
VTGNPQAEVEVRLTHLLELRATGLVTGEAGANCRETSYEITREII